MKKFWLLLVIFSLSVPIFSQDKPIITVLDFDANEVSQADMRSIISLLSSALFRTDYFTIIDVSQRETVLKEMEFSLSGCSDESCMLEIGKLLSAEAIVMGSIGRVGSKYVLSAKLLETETAKTLSTADGIYSDLDTLLDAISDISGELSAPYAIFPVAEELPQEINESALSEKPGDVGPKPREAQTPSNLNFPAVASLAGGIGSVGLGAYFILAALPTFLDYLDAKAAYENAESDGDVTALWNSYEAARQEAVDLNVNTNLVLGASLTGVGIALTTLSIVLFNRAPDKSPVEVALLPGTGVTTLAWRISY